MTPEIAAHLAAHDERLKSVESLTEKLEKRLDWILGLQFTVLIGLVINLLSKH